MASDMKVRLFPGGPEFPAEFLDLIQKGQMVFFCGAGLSVGTGLPTFSGLVQELDKKVNPDPVDRFDYTERKDYDRMLDELEGRFMGGRKRMCEHVRDILSKPPSDPKGIFSPDEVLENHRNILKLAAVSDGGFRLVTTNFDDRFALANGGAIQSKNWPELPSLKDNQWASLVHLHGRIRDDARSGDLILTASDFGSAYILGDRRAADFVIDLLRRWPVIFVGYGLNDPPMDYLVRAVYDRRNSSEMFQQAFALVGCEAGEENKQRQEWEGKRVSPILYNKADCHKALGEILGNLAHLRNESNYRAELAIQGVDKNPDDEDDDNGRRVIWALKNPAIAEEFAKQKDITDGDKFVRWLDAFKKAGLFQANKAAPINALDCSWHSASNLPPIAYHLAYWAARHAHQPALLWWLVSTCANLHPQFIWQINHCVNRGVAGKGIPDELVERWNLYLQEQPISPHFGLWLSDFPAPDKSDWVASNREQLIIAALRPSLRVVPGDSFLLPEERERFKVEVTIDCEMSGNDFRMYSAREYVKKTKFAVVHAEALATHMETAASLMKRCGINTFSLRCFRPEEDDHYDTPHWLFLTLLIRDAVLEMIKAGDISRLKKLVSRWTEHECLLPRRLALFAIAETAKLSEQMRVPADWGAKSIIARPDILWTLESRRESCRFLRKAGMGITLSTRDKLERVIREGPPRSMYRKDFPEEEIVKAMRRQIAICLAKLGISAPLSPESAHVLRLVRKAEPKMNFERCMEYHSSKIETFWEEDEHIEQVAPDWTKMSEKKCAGFIQSAKRLNLSALVKENSNKAVKSFEILANKKFWERDKWSLFLNEFGRNADIPKKVAVRLARLLEAMPEKLARALVLDYAYAMRSVSHALPFSEIESAWRRAWEFDLDPSPTISGNHHISQLDIAINHTHGQLAEIPLICFRHKKEREKLKCVFAEILASKKKSHKYGKILIASRLSMLFHNSPEWAKWAKQHLLPFFAPKHSMAFGMWEAFLYSPTVSADLLDALKPGLVHFLKRADTFYSRANNLVGIFVIGCQMHPGIVSRDEKRRIVAGMNSKGIEHLCRHMERKLRERDQNGATLAKAWKELVFPFLREVWPEKRWPPNEMSEISQTLASVIMLTGDAFPEAFEWAKDFLSPIIGHSRGHPITDLCYGHHQQDENIPKKFPQECLQFLRRIIPDDNFGHRHDLRVLLDKIKANNPELERHPDFIHLREIASGG